MAFHLLLGSRRAPHATSSPAFCLSLACSSGIDSASNSQAGESRARGAQAALGFPPRLRGPTGKLTPVALEIVPRRSRAGYTAIHDIAPLGELLSNLRATAAALRRSCALWRRRARAVLALLGVLSRQSLDLVGPKASTGAKAFSSSGARRSASSKTTPTAPSSMGDTEPVFVRGESTEANLRALTR
jgi:hypothetical protein